MTEFEKQAVAIALKKMFQGSHFNICTVDQCLKITGAIPPSADYNALSALHCVHWSDMPASFRDEVFVKTLELFRHSGFQIDQIMLSATTGHLRALQ